MKKYIISVFVLIISINTFASGRIDAKVMQHPLVESCYIDTSNDCFGWAFTLKLKNGHEIYFSDVKSDLTFNKWSNIHYINDVRFSTVEFEPFKKGGDYGCLQIKDFCKATGTNYNDLYSILDNYIEFCKLLNSIPWRLDKNAEKLCAKYSDNHYVYLYRGGRALNEENKFIEIPEE